MKPIYALPIVAFLICSTSFADHASYACDPGAKQKGCEFDRALHQVKEIQGLGEALLYERSQLLSLSYMRSFPSTIFKVTANYVHAAKNFNDSLESFLSNGSMAALVKNKDQSKLGKKLGKEQLEEMSMQPYAIANTASIHSLKLNGKLSQFNYASEHQEETFENDFKNLGVEIERLNRLLKEAEKQNPKLASLLAMADVPGTLNLMSMTEDGQVKPGFSFQLGFKNILNPFALKAPTTGEMSHSAPSTESSSDQKGDPQEEVSPQSSHPVRAQKL